MQVGYEKIAILTSISFHRMSTLRPSRCYKHGTARPWQVGGTHRWQQSAAEFVDGLKR